MRWRSLYGANTRSQDARGGLSGSGSCSLGFTLNRLVQDFFTEGFKLFNGPLYVEAFMYNL